MRLARDPIRNPVAGDLVVATKPSGRTIVRRVVWRSKKFVVSYDGNDKWDNGQHMACLFEFTKVQTWRRWCHKKRELRVYLAKEPSDANQP